MTHKPYHPCYICQNHGREREGTLKLTVRIQTPEQELETVIRLCTRCRGYWRHLIQIQDFWEEDPA